MSNKEQNKTVSQEVLESCREALYTIRESLDSISNTDLSKLDILDRLEVADRVNKIIGALGKSIETLGILEAKVQKEELEKSHRRGGGKTSKFEE